MVNNKPKLQHIFHCLVELTCAIFRPSSPTCFNLPFHIIAYEILPKLPAKSLLRFKTVCKSFYNLICSPEFIRLHLQNSFSSDNNRLLVFPATNHTLYTYDLRSLSNTAICWLLDSNLVVGSCNGLLLITGFFSCSDHRDIILNPSTRTYIAVPSAAPNLGFGYDHHTDDYKIVAVSSEPTTIYSVNSKSWRVVDECINPLKTKPHPVGGVLINNHLLHWIFSVPWKCKYVIACFDVCLEKWIDDVPLPSCYYDVSDKRDLCLGVLEDRLFVSFENGDDLTYNVWVMKEYGVKESWMRLLRVPISHKHSVDVLFVACWDAGLGKVLLQHCEISKMFWYNRVNNMINKAKVPEFWKLQPYICYDSLVVLPEAKRFGALHERHLKEYKLDKHNNQGRIQPYGLMGLGPRRNSVK